VHDTEQSWERSGRKDILDEAREKVDHILKTHKPLPLGEEIEKELNNIQKRAHESSDG
jgi:trimethylamine:corrinoid methyltransferase-like protein